MRLADLSVVTRERGLGELYDLAVRLTARHAGALALFGMVWMLPIALAIWPLAWLLPPEHWLSTLGIWGLAAWSLAPVQTAPITAYIGQAMFSHDPSVRAALGLALRQLPTLLVVALLRGLATIAGLIGMLFFPIHVSECLLLERLPANRAFGRARQLYAFYNQENITHLLINLVAGAACLLVAGAFLWDPLRLSPLGERTPIELLALLHPRHLVLVLVMLLPTAFCAVLRFCSYIDLRTRREGWELELALRQAGERLTGGPS